MAAAKERGANGRQSHLTNGIEQTDILLTMLHGIHKKDGCYSTFQWGSIAEQLKEKTTKDLHVLVLKNKYNYMKKQWTAWTRLRYSVIGAGLDDEHFKVTTTEEWWERQKLEDFITFNKNPPSRETSRMWDDLFEYVVATGKNVVATSSDQLQIVHHQETCQEESSGGNDSDVDPDIVDDETETPLGDTQETPQSVPSKKSNKSGAYDPSISGESVKNMKRTRGNKLFVDICEMVSNAILEFIKAIKGSKSSAAATIRNEQDEAEFDAALTHLNDLVAIGLVKADSRLWCYGMTELAKADRKRIFMKCKTDAGKVVWLQHEYDMAVARLPL